MDFFFVAGSAAVTGVFTYLWLKKSKTLAAVEVCFTLQMPFCLSLVLHQASHQLTHKEPLFCFQG